MAAGPFAAQGEVGTSGGSGSHHPGYDITPFLDGLEWLMQPQLVYPAQEMITSPRVGG